MSRRQSAAVDKALAKIGKPRRGGGLHTPYSAAKLYGLAFSTIYRALERQKGNK